MKLSIIIICWNDLKTIQGCLDSIYQGTHSTAFEIIVSDNGSSDASVEFIRAHYPEVRVIENKANLRFAKANNVGIRASRGEYVLILNPDTIIHEGTLDQLVTFADEHPEAGAFGCKVLNPDGSYQESARPFPTLRGEWIAALYLRPLAYLSDWFISDTYTGWNGDTQRTVDWLSGCSLFVRRDALERISGFDDQFFYYYEDVDLCRRIWQAGYTILFTPRMSITHLGGQSTKRFPIAFQLDSEITKYRYFYKYFGKGGVRECRRVTLVSLFIRRLGYRFLQLVGPSDNQKPRLEALRVTYEWNKRVDSVRLVENGEEPTALEPLVRVLER
ncbi:MAG: glycosyltransferase family 2 protein [Candidatus Sulfotelmatobacter sp.]